MATAEQLKALIRSHNGGDDEHFRAIAMQIAAASAKKGDTQLAQELRQLLDEAQRKQTPVGLPRAVPIARPAGELAGLVTASYPNVRLADMVLSDSVRSQLEALIGQYHQRDLLRSNGLAPKRKLLLIGPPGCGKTMSASAIAGECGLPLMFVQLHSLITKYMGETAAKLHLVFDAMIQTHGVYLFDEFDAIGAERGTRNDVGEIRRVLNSFLQFLERDDSESIIIAATNFARMLDTALFRRFDDIVSYELPSASMVRTLVENRLTVFDLSGLKWRQIVAAASRLSHAEVTRACEEAARKAVLATTRTITSDSLQRALKARHHLSSRRGSKEIPRR
ncbi:MAG: ATP-binding protein [Tepidisphaeraceae bacterium]